MGRLLRIELLVLVLLVSMSYVSVRAMAMLLLLLLCIALLGVWVVLVADLLKVDAALGLLVGVYVLFYGVLDDGGRCARGVYIRE